MTDSQTLLLIMVAIYLSECATWASAHAIAFSRRRRQGWTWTLPGKPLGNANGGLIFSQPLPPLAPGLLTHFWPLSISADGLLTSVAAAAGRNSRPTDAETFIRWDEIERIGSDGKTILVNDQRIHRTDSVAEARRIAKSLKKVGDCDQWLRVTEIDRLLDESLDVEAAGQLKEDFHAQTLTLRMLCNWLFVHCFVICPFISWRWGLERTWWMLLAALVFLVVCIVIGTIWANRQLRPGVGLGAHPLVMLLNPLAAIRAVDLLGRDLFARFHPLALSSLLEDDNSQRELAGLILRDALHPLQPILFSDSVAAAETEAWFRARSQAAIERCLQRDGIETSPLLTPADEIDQSSRTFCPRCLGQYLLETGDCSTCGVELRRLPERVEQAGATELPAE